jgi:outer membrane protein OmpA-like peptidoglycan-associated protein
VKYTRNRPKQDAGYVWAAVADAFALVIGTLVLTVVAIALVPRASKEDADGVAAAAPAPAGQASVSTERLARLELLEQALASSIRAGEIQVLDGRIGILANVLFELNQAKLTEEGETIVASLAPPLVRYLATCDDSVMVSGFTDDLAIHAGPYHDNWRLSLERALTVMRHLVRAGVPESRVFAAGFGEHRPVTPNVDEGSRAQNRRVEIVPIPKTRGTFP